MASSCGLAVFVLLLAATATAATKPLGEEPQDHLAGGANGLLSQQKDDPAAARIASADSALASVRLAEKRDGGGDAAMPMSGMAIQGGDPGTVPKAGSGDGNGNGNGNESGEHGKEQGGSGKEAEREKSAAAKSCLTKEECHKKRLLCGKGCTLSAHAKCAAKCSKSCIPTC